MPIDIFVPAKNPSPQSTVEVRPRVNIAQFGDGYAQRSGDGLNASPRTYQAKWPGLSLEERDEMISFFEAHKFTPFRWTPPLETVERKWVATSWSPAVVLSDVVSLSATFTQDFSL